MFISKYVLNMNSSEVRKAISDVDKMHKFVWSLFEDTSDFCVSREGLGILYRVIYKGDKVFLIVQSKMKPNYEMKESNGTQIYCVTDEVMKQKLASCQVVNFNIKTNPTYYDENNKRKYISRVSERYAWIKRQAEKNGFEILYVDELNSDFVKGQKGENKITFGASEMQGRLKIVDFDKFYSCVSEGLGRSKSYGMGMFMFGV